MTAQTSEELRVPAVSRLFAAAGPDLAEHRRTFGPPPQGVAELTNMVTDAGLTGRGGAGFPTGRKIAAAGRNAAVIANAAEGEPLSDKDATLLHRAPHLVLDGLTEVAAALDARTAYVYLPARCFAGVRHALDERGSAGWNTVDVTLVVASDTFVAGEETAVIRRIEGGAALPKDRVTVIAQSGLRGRPTLVSNVETLAHLALIARFGPRWFRSVGEVTDPGTMLVTLSGAVRFRGVVEVPTGIPLAELIGRFGGTDHRRLRAVLAGGYHGSWIPADAVRQAHLSRKSLSPWGAGPGAGIVHTLAVDECGVAETADIVAYLAEQSAAQCGPCAIGLPTLARLLGELADGSAGSGLVDEIRRIAALVEGRGACRHPDGTARFVRSALKVFAHDVALHERGRCEVAHR